MQVSVYSVVEKILLRRSITFPICYSCGFRREADKDPNLETQLDVFDEHKANDDEQLPGAKGVDLNSALDVFHAIYRQVRLDKEKT